MALLVIVVLAGYLGSGTALDNLAPTFILITFWVGLVFASALFGDVFRAFSPWRAIGRVLPSAGLRPYPERLGRWPAAAGLLMFTWIELASGWGEDPALLVTAALGYTVLTLVAQVMWGVEAWTRHGETFAVYYSLFSRISPFETRDRVVGLRPPLGGPPAARPGPRHRRLRLGDDRHRHVRRAQPGPAVEGHRDRAHGRRRRASGSRSPTPPGSCRRSGSWSAWCSSRSSTAPASPARARSAATSASSGCGGAFVHSLVPIAMVYVAAHYLTFLLFEGQAIRYLASDPFGQGWDLFGTATAAIDYSLLSQNGAWYAQVAFVVVGHVAALILAHDRALALYGGDAKLAVRSQYWMLAIMVGFTTLALWLLAQAGHVAQPLS